MKSLITKPLTALLIVGITSVALISCHKKTKAQFVLNKYEYSAGEMLEITNLKPKKNQHWDITDSEGTLISDTIIERNPQIILSLLIPNDYYSINLYDNRAEYIKRVKTSKTFLVKTTRTWLKISANSSSNKIYDVYVDGENVGNTTNGKFNIQIPVGVRNLKIVLANSTKNETIILKEGIDKSFSF